MSFNFLAAATVYRDFGAQNCRRGFFKDEVSSLAALTWFEAHLSWDLEDKQESPQEEERRGWRTVLAKKTRGERENSLARRTSEWNLLIESDQVWIKDRSGRSRSQRLKRTLDYPFPSSDLLPVLYIVDSQEDFNEKMLFSCLICIMSFLSLLFPSTGT